MPAEPRAAPLHQTTDISTSAGAALELMSPFSPPNLAKSLPRIIWVQREHREDRENKLIRAPESEPTVSLKNNSLMVYLINRTTKLSFKGPAPLCEGTQYFFFFCVVLSLLCLLNSNNNSQRYRALPGYQALGRLLYGNYPPLQCYSRRYIFSYWTLILMRETEKTLEQCHKEGSYITRGSVFTGRGRRENPVIRPGEFHKQFLADICLSGWCFSLRRLLPSRR